MKNLKRGSVLGGIFFLLLVMSTVEARAQGNSELRTYVTALIAQMEQSKAKIAQLEAALTNEIRARQAADTALQNAINGISGGGVTQAVLNAAIASEATARDVAIAAEALLRSTADEALQGQISNEVVARQALATTVASFSTLTPLVPLATHVSVQPGAINGLAGPHVIFTGVNVHVRSGVPDSLAANGLGNLIVGYNELPFDQPFATDVERDGSHNVVIGASHRYNFGTGLVFGYASRLGGMAASVSGGGFNNAGGEFATVSGGSNNWATGQYSQVSGGDSNTASGNTAAVAAGQMNTASGQTTAVSGGYNNSATATSSTVGGGNNLINGTANSFIP